MALVRCPECQRSISDKALTIGTHTIYNSPELREFLKSLLGSN